MPVGTVQAQDARGCGARRRGGPPRSDGRYARRDLLDDHLLVALPARHRLAPPERRAAGAVGRTLDRGRHARACQEAGLSACAAAGFTPEIAHRVDDWSALLRLVAAGCGVGLVPLLALAGRRPDGVALRQPAGPQRPCRHLYAAVRAGVEGSPCLVPVLAALEGAVRARLDGAPRRGAEPEGRAEAQVEGRPR